MRVLSWKDLARYFDNTGNLSVRHRNGKGERAVKTNTLRDSRARKIRIVNDVVNPGGLPALGPRLVGLMPRLDDSELS